MTKDKRGDVFDGMMFYAKQGINNNPYSNKSLNYPPDTQDLMLAFVNTWKLAIESIPDETEKEYSRWIKEFRELRKIVGYGSKMNETLRVAYDIYVKFSFSVNSPGAVIKICNTAKELIGKKNDEKQLLFAKIEEDEKREKLLKQENEDDKQEDLKRLRKMKRKLYEEE
jgi:hypothetical protein